MLGATLIAGLGPGQLFEGLVESDALDPVLELRCESFSLQVPASRKEFAAQFAGEKKFFALQAAAADALWPLLDEPSRLLPRNLWKAASPRVLRFTGRPLTAVLDACGVRDQRLRLYCDALCQITVQTDAARAEAPVALATLDYPFRGARHVRGGVGELAWALLRKAQAAGAQPRMADAVKSIAPGFVIRSRRGETEARAVVANVLPRALQKLAGVELPKLQDRVETGWGACMLYLSLKGPQPARHLQLIADSKLPLTHGNHVFCSVSGDTCTISTHVRIPVQAAGVQARMLQTLQLRAPELWEERESHFTASPRTFERFTGRPEGYVGGIPRRAGLKGYLDVLQPSLPRGLYLCGDTIFPGQSALAAALGGMLAARRALRGLP